MWYATQDVVCHARTHVKRFIDKKEERIVVYNIQALANRKRTSLKANLTKREFLEGQNEHENGPRWTKSKMGRCEI